MQDRFQRMDCYILAGDKAADFESTGELTRLERGYRRYAALFEKVGLVLKRSDATERYLNYPHVCREDGSTTEADAVVAALERSASDAVFIGRSDITEFPLELAFELVKQYDGEPFLGYVAESGQQPMFGIYHKRLASRLKEARTGGETLSEILSSEGRLLPLPDSADADHIGLG